MIEVEHVKARRIQKERQELPLFEKFITEGNEKADELAKAGALLDGGFMAQARASTIQPEREDVHGMKEWKDCEELQPKPQEKWKFVDKGKEETKYRTEWCAEAKKYRCTRRGRGRQVSEDARKMCRTKVVDKGHKHKFRRW